MKAIILIGLLFATTFCACMWVSRTLEKSHFANPQSQILIVEEVAR